MIVWHQTALNTVLVVLLNGGVGYLAGRWWGVLAAAAIMGITLMYVVQGFAKGRDEPKLEHHE